MLVLLTAATCNGETAKADFYVATSGSDRWSGTLATANTQRTDGPFRTLERARDAVRILKEQKTSDILVLIRGGTHRPEKTVVFSLPDSGSPDSTITYAAYPGETPVFSSGRQITGWRRVAGDLPGLPEKARGNVWAASVSSRFFTLYDARGMLPRARSSGFIPLMGGSRNRLHFPKGRLKNWLNLEDVEIVVRPHHAWISNVLPLASVNEESQLARTSVDATYAMNPLHFLKTTESCWVENVLEDLDEPGEWVLNTDEGTVYLWPRHSSPDTSPVFAPTLTELIRVEGDVDRLGPKDTPVRNLRFRGLAFMHGDRYSVTEDDAGLQHDWDMYDKANALVRLRGTENCSIEQCHFAHSGSGAIRVDLHGQQNTISGNHIEEMGGGGILLCGYGPGTKDVNKENLVYNNHIHHAGRIYLHSPGIMVWQSGKNRIANNLIHHMPYSGVVVSGCMPHFFERNGRELSKTIRRHELRDLPGKPKLDDVRPYLHTRDNMVEYNDIHHVMERMGDGNGIYIRGAGAGNVIRRNYVHHLVTPMKMQAAIRTDGGQRDTLIAENLIYKCTAQGIILKLNNRCENNIVADVLAPPRGYYLSLREGPMANAVIKRNIFFSAGKDTTFIDELPPGKGRQTEDRRGRVLARAKDADTDYNIYCNATDHTSAEEMLQKQQGNGVDSHSVAVDPGFFNPAKGDFRLKPDSPARKLGFVPFDMSKVGLVDHEEGTRVAVQEAQTPGISPPKKRTAKQKPSYLDTDGERKLNVVYKSVSGRDLELDLYYPIGKRTDKCPVIVFTHGGGWAAGNRYKVARGSFAEVFGRLIKQGFAVSPVSYRLAKKGSNVAMRDCVIDCKDAIRFLATHCDALGVDADRIFVMGDSAGGHIAQMLLLASPEDLPGAPALADVSYRMVAGVSWYGPSDFVKIDLFNHDNRANFKDRFAARILGSKTGPQDKLSRYQEMSPVNYLSKLSPPLLMIQGDSDTTIPVKHAYYMKERAEAVDAPVATMIIKNSGHNWRSVGSDIEPSRDAIVERTVKFFVQHRNWRSERE